MAIAIGDDLSNKLETDIYIVGVNIDKIAAFQLAKQSAENGVYRVAHGIYFVSKNPSHETFKDIFERYSFRIAHTTFPDSALTHSTAFSLKPDSKRFSSKVFLGGAYSYRKKIAEAYGDFSLIQSSISINRMQRDKKSAIDILSNAELFDTVEFNDSLGTFSMRVQTREFMTLTQFDNIKGYKEKLISESDLANTCHELLKKYRSRSLLLEKMEHIAWMTGKNGEYSRFSRFIEDRF